MGTNWSRRTTFLAIVGFTVIGFGAWMVFLVTGWLLLRTVGLRFDFWAMTEALSTAVAAAAVFGAGFVAYRELSEASASRHIAVADRLFEELNAAQSVAARRWIFQHLPDDPSAGLAALTVEGRDSVKRVLNSLDRVAFLTQDGWIPDELIMPWMNPMVVKSWLKLKPYVDYESQRRHEPDYYRQVRRLGEHCLAWRKQHLGGAEITWVDNAL